MKVTAAANVILNYHVRGTTPSALTPYLGLFTAYATPTEVTGGSYARVAMTTTNFSSVAASNAISNTVEISFPAASAGWGDVIGFGVWDASTAGNVVRKSFLTTGVYRLFTALNAGDVFTIPGHSFANNDRVAVLASDGVSLPTGVTADTLYYVVGVSGSTLQLSTTLGGGAVTLTADGAGILVKVVPQTVNSGSTAKFAIGSLTFKEF